MNETFAMTVDTVEQLKELLSNGIEPVAALADRSVSAHTVFSLAEILESPGVSVLYNRMFFENELEDIQQELAVLADANIQHVYFADPAVVQLSSEALRRKLIYRPETLVTSHLDAQYWMSLGLSHVSVSPLITEEEVVSIVAQVPGMELTVFGALVESISRRRLLSAWTSAYDRPSLSFRHGLSLVEEKRQEHMPVFEDEYGTIIYTDFIQESFTTIRTFRKAGAQRFFVESIGLSFKAACEAIFAMQRILAGEDAESVKKEYTDRFEPVTYSTGYYGQKTIQ